MGIGPGSEGEMRSCSGDTMLLCTLASVFTEFEYMLCARPNRLWINESKQLYRVIAPMHAHVFFIK